MNRCLPSYIYCLRISYVSMARVLDIMIATSLLTLDPVEGRSKRLLGPFVARYPVPVGLDPQSYMDKLATTLYTTVILRGSDEVIWDFNQYLSIDIFAEQLLNVALRLLEVVSKKSEAERKNFYLRGIHSSPFGARSIVRLYESRVSSSIIEEIVDVIATSPDMQMEKIFDALKYALKSRKCFVDVARKF